MHAEYEMKTRCAERTQRNSGRLSVVGRQQKRNSVCGTNPPPYNLKCNWRSGGDEVPLGSCRVRDEVSGRKNVNIEDPTSKRKRQVRNEPMVVWAVLHEKLPTSNWQTTHDRMNGC